MQSVTTVFLVAARKGLVDDRQVKNTMQYTVRYVTRVYTASGNYRALPIQIYNVFDNCLPLNSLNLIDTILNIAIINFS